MDISYVNYQFRCDACNANSDNYISKEAARNGLTWSGWRLGWFGSAMCPKCVLGPSLCEKLADAPDLAAYLCRRLNGEKQTKAK
jgi:hypothetical protein